MILAMMKVQPSVCIIQFAGLRLVFADLCLVMMKPASSLQASTTLQRRVTGLELCDVCGHLLLLYVHSEFGFMNYDSDSDYDSNS